jgi:uracil-DNA glycosylase family 4
VVAAAVAAEAVAAVTELHAYGDEVAGCTRCALAGGRTQVVFGSGDPNADLMFVGEAPGFHEDKQGVPFVGAAGKLLDQLLAGIGLTRADVYVANVLKCLGYTAQVQLGDGSWERIGRLVRRRYDGTVMSVASDGTLVPRRVIGWHTSPLGDRSVFRLSYRSAKRAGAKTVGIQLTGDHPVLTEGGFVRADELERGDRVATGVGLSRLARDVICGTLLGDASLSASSAHVSLSHSERQSAYALFKADLLKELAPSLASFSVAAVAGGPKAYQVIQVRTAAHRALRVLRDDFYEDRKVVPRWMSDELNDRMLAIWFMDDGHMRIRKGRQPIAELATVGFSDKDLRILREGLLRLGLPTTALRGRLHFDVATTRSLSRRISPYTPPSMRYRLHPDDARETPFDPSLLQIGPPEVFYDEVEVEDVSDRIGTDRTFFCIDVEETHNFVTAGGVVHNCRPPGNRDPLPEEIEACEGHLWRQIELIEPRVVATLGNFATKLLSGRPTGITRVHGQEQETTLGGRCVLLYPIYHPAAALYTPRMLEVLKSDFARLPELLGREVAPPTEPVSLARVTAEPAVQLGLF